ncbi:UNVERIFIED_CONTAM: hypothetical protein Sangu_2785500 [Sesamum angustifolium]|uniref:Uncharacterized protein n=1 Tax=Sesamum angustifolium TaxID=2727405 RepID=A0AAW2IT79_9LAMI
MTLRNGKEIQLAGPTPKKARIEKTALDNTDALRDKIDSNLVPYPSSNTCALPFPYRMPKSKEEEQEREILDIFKKIEINIPLLDALKQIPKYVKFLKELCTNKGKLKDKKRIIFGKNVSTVINRLAATKPIPEDWYKIFQVEDLETGYPESYGDFHYVLQSCFVDIRCWSSV